MKFIQEVATGYLTREGNVAGDVLVNYVPGSSVYSERNYFNKSSEHVIPLGEKHKLVASPRNSTQNAYAFRQKGTKSVRATRHTTNFIYRDKRTAGYTVREPAQT